MPVTQIITISLDDLRKELRVLIREEMAAFNQTRVSSDDLLTPSEARRIVRIGNNTLMNALASHDLIAQRAPSRGGKLGYLIRRADLCEWSKRIRRDS